MKKYTRGFTLIELLVVIAIIGILSSVVLVSLNSARSKGKDGRIQTEVSQLRTQLETGFNGTGYPDLQGGTSNYAATTTITNAAFNTVIADILSQQGYTLSSGKLNTSTLGSNANGVAIYSEVTSGTPTTYSIYAKMVAGGYFCLSSGGTTKNVTSGSWIVPTSSFDTCQ